ncbi:MAG TPA: alpha/beta hydrolase [Ruania sp.]|nr:alpha/beta hydrolase [Ruania sp.]
MTFQRAPLHLHPRAHELRRDGAEGFVLCLPGGGYEHRSDHEGPGITDFLATHGIAAGHLDYSVAPARYPQALSEVLLTLADLRSGEHGDITGPIAVIGFSAGGHLAGNAATATESERAAAARAAGLRPEQVVRPDLVTLAYPVASLVNRAHVGSRLSLLGEDAPESLAVQLSLENRTDADVPPLFCWHTAEDEGVPVENSLHTTAAWRRAGVPVELHVYPHGPHGVGLATEHGEPVNQWPAAWLQWLARHGVKSAT